MAETTKDFPLPSYARVWQALQILYGPALKAATVTVLMIDDKKTLFDSCTMPDIHKDG